MAKEKKEGDSLFWAVEESCYRLQITVAESHAKRGNVVVLFTPRTVRGPDMDALEGHGVKVVSTRGQR